MFAVMAYAITVTASFTTANLFGGGITMVKWLIIGFLLACVFICMVQIGEIMDYDPAWDETECWRGGREPQKRDGEPPEGEQEIDE